MRKIKSKNGDTKPQNKGMNPRKKILGVCMYLYINVKDRMQNTTHVILSGANYSANHTEAIMLRPVICKRLNQCILLTRTLNY